MAILMSFVPRFCFNVADLIGYMTADLPFHLPVFRGCRANKLCLRDRVKHRLGSRSTACNWTVVCCPVVEPLLFLSYPVRLLRLLACGTKMSWMRAKLSFVFVIFTGFRVTLWCGMLCYWPYSRSLAHFLDEISTTCAHSPLPLALFNCSSCSSSVALISAFHLKFCCVLLVSIPLL